MIEPTRNEVAFYRSATARNELLREVREWLNGIPSGDLPTASHALAWLRDPAGGTDLRYTAGRFYVLGEDALWTMDDEADSLTGQHLQRWAQAVAREVDTYDRELRAAHEAAASDGGDDSFTDAYDRLRAWFNKAAGAWSKRAQSGPARERITADLRKMAGVLLPSPETFDADPDAIAVANGIVNLRTGEIRSLRASDYATQRIDVSYDPSAKAELWEQFLSEILVTDDGRTTDTELVSWVGRLIGYGITGHAREQVFAQFLGSGANGKSVLLETLGDLFEPIARTAAMSTFEAERTGSTASGDLARLHAARIVFASEGEVGKRISAATVKRITGEDRITARFLYRPEFEFRPRFLLIMASNTKAPVIDSSEGYWRRLRVVPFLRYFEPSERDASLRNRLRNEFPGILAWAIQGAREWYAFGLGTTAVIEARTEGYRREMDQLGEFMADRLAVTGNRQDAVSGKEVWVAYAEWVADLHDDKPMQRRTMIAAFGERKGVKRDDAPNGNVRFRGVRMLDTTERRRADADGHRLAELPSR